MSAIARVIENCFLDSRQRVAITVLVLQYMQEKVDVIFNRFTLQTSYALWNKQDALRSKPLRIVYIRTEEHKQHVDEILRKWEQMTITQAQKNSQSFWILYTALIGMARRGIFNRGLNTVVVNAQNVIEGISYSCPDEDRPQARRILCIITAPWNQIDGHHSVRGAGTALIEHAALQSLKQQNINPDADLVLAKKAVVTLQAAASSYAFYDKLFFTLQPSRIEMSMILQGNNMSKFFTRFGGRASCPKGSIEV